MSDLFSKLLDQLSEFLAPRKGLLPFLGIFLILINFLIVIFFDQGFLVTTNLFLHFGAIIAILGFLLARAL